MRSVFDKIGILFFILSTTKLLLLVSQTRCSTKHISSNLKTKENNNKDTAKKCKLPMKH